VQSLSYSSLSDYLRCGYRFYVERVLGMPPVAARDGGAAAGRPRGAVLDPAERGSAVHALLEGLDFRRPLIPPARVIAAAAARHPSEGEVAGIATLIERFAASAICGRLGRATRVRREQPFAFLLDEVLITGALDVIAAEPGNRTLVVDYKTDRLDGSEPAAVVEREYRTQRLIYALAALRDGAGEVEVAHVFLEAPDRPVTAAFRRAEEAELEQELRGLSAGVRGQDFRVTDVPRREICHGCPAEGGLCSWPLEMTRREGPDTLF
jgi:RecB family exonuclease